jgi:hypothetical protein
MKKKKRLATLNPIEENSWVYYFTYYVINQRKSNAEADRLTWRDMRREFPRLHLYDGARP